MDEELKKDVGRKGEISKETVTAIASQPGSGDSSRRKRTRDVLEMLECHICMEEPRQPPIFNCVNGHILCQHCLSKVALCGICRVSLKEPVRNLFAEKILTRTLKDATLSCKFEDCQFQAALPEMILHDSTCVRRTIPCASGHRGACEWKGKLYNLVRHIVDNKCMQVVKRAKQDGPEGHYTSVIADFEGEEATVIGKTTVTHWKPALLASDELVHLFGYLTVMRDWTLVALDGTRFPAVSSDSSTLLMAQIE